MCSRRLKLKLGHKIKIIYKNPETAPAVVQSDRESSVCHVRVSVWSTACEECAESEIYTNPPSAQTLTHKSIDACMFLMSAQCPYDY